jgi:hypothetical protein
MRSVFRFMLLVILLVPLAGCGANPSVRAGAWEGSTPYGDFTFYITEDGTAIEDIAYSVRCGENWTDDSNFRMGEPYPLDGRKLDFGVWLAGQVPMAVWKGEFSADGKTLSGELSLFADLCVTDFEITR